jgi:hypothetical protein
MANALDSRLNGWKEIAAFLGKSDRTAHRWERRLGLPIHRIHTDDGGEIVYALASEIERWLRDRDSASERSASRQTSKVPSSSALADESSADLGGSRVFNQPNQAGHERHARRLPVLAVAGSVIGAVVLTAWTAWPRNTVPSGWEVVGSLLVVRDSSGRTVFTKQFDYPLSPYLPSDSRKAPIADIEGDGSKEVIFVAASAIAGFAKRFLYCFEHDGTERFRHQVNGTVTFGGTAHGGPFVPVWVWVTPEPGGRSSIWLSSQHTDQFPAVLQRLDGRGNVLSNYWSNGHIETFADVAVAGRRHVVVGATTNEFGRATVAILDYDDANGAAPAAKEQYRCRDCPPALPLVYAVLPRMELWDWRKTKMSVGHIKVSDGTHPITLEILASSGPAPGDSLPLQWSALYWMDSDFQIVKGEFGSDYEHAHARLEIPGHIDHPYSRTTHECDLWPVLIWQDGRYKEDWGLTDCKNRPRQPWQKQDR